MKFITLILLVSIVTSANAVENRADSLKQCLNQQEQSLNHVDSKKVVSAAIQCMTGFLSEVNKEEEPEKQENM